MIQLPFWLFALLLVSCWVLVSATWGLIWVYRKEKRELLAQLQDTWEYSRKERREWQEEREALLRAALPSFNVDPYPERSLPLSPDQREWQLEKDRLARAGLEDADLVP